MKYYLLLILGIIFTQFGYCQSNSFLNEGSITFERRVNLYPVLESLLKANKNLTPEAIQKITSDFKANNEQFSVRTFSLKFKDQKTIYTPTEDKEINPVSFLAQAAFKNTVYSDLDAKQSVINKFFFDHNVTVKDSLRKIKWRLTDETRTIANYLCRRANALVMDSVYIVAYYTDQIITKSGPESFQGLPGMILGVAAPDEHITWFATAVTNEPGGVINYNAPPQEPILTQNTYRDNTIKFLNEHSANTRWFLNFLCY